MTTRQPEALRLAEILEGGYSLAWLYERGGYEVSAELRRQHARITELESQLEAVGAGGVGPLIASAGFDAADMATASAQGFRGGAASVDVAQERPTPEHIEAMQRAWLWMENQAEAQSKGGNGNEHDVCSTRQEPVVESPPALGLEGSGCEGQTWRYTCAGHDGRATARDAFTQQICTCSAEAAG